MAARMAAMMAAIGSDGKTSVSAPTTCPLYPGARIALLMPASALMVAARQLPAFETSARLSLPDDPADLAGPSRAHPGRGPPNSLPS